MRNLLIQLQFFSDFDGSPQFPEIFKIHENAKMQLNYCVQKKAKASYFNMQLWNLGKNFI